MSNPSNTKATEQTGEALTLAPNDLHLPPPQAISSSSFVLDPWPVDLSGNTNDQQLSFEDVFDTESPGEESIAPQSSGLGLSSALRKISLPTDIVPSPADSSDVSTPGIPSIASGSKPPPKIGTRFSKEAVRTLREWLSMNSENPYPNDEDKERLQVQTGLNKTQISNWLANARRRGMMQPSRPRRSQPRMEQATTPIEIPRRAGTPSIRSGKQHLNPLERWFDSPPEDEPAAMTAIARAIAPDQSDTESSPALKRYAWDGEDRYDNLHPSSTGTSRSSASSFSSARSYISSRDSSPSKILAHPRLRSKRRSRRRRDGKARTSLVTPLNRYQCTFCTETYRTKHDWQRHEKSLHLPLDRWTCAPAGPRIVHADTGEAYCAYCGEVNPEDSHIQSHNPSLCQEKTFSRKDHLKQHLRLVHNTGSLDHLVNQWKVPTPKIQSRCGFCGIRMDSWEFRVDHLADHFKMGQSMAAWQGDWGFDEEVLKMVENAIPPYLIDDERKTPDPYMATNAPVESPRHAYELLQSELTWYLQNHDCRKGGIPTSEELQLEACRIIYAAEVMMLTEATTSPGPTSWLRDLITSNESICQQAQFGPIRSQSESALSIPKLYAKEALWEGCPLEAHLREFVRNLWDASEREPLDSELQVEACKLVSISSEKLEGPPYSFFSSWLINLVGSSTSWLANFRRRACGLASRNAPPAAGLDWSTITLTDSRWPSLQGIFNAPALHGQSASAIATHGQAHVGNEPEAALENMPLPNLADPSGSLSQGIIPSPRGVMSMPTSETPTHQAFSLATPQQDAFRSPHELNEHAAFDHRPPWIKNSLLFLNDANFHKWLARELGRWVLATISPNNPNRHTPSDEELRHQARWILYDDDDPFNPTAADNAEWLRRFKRDYGILDGPDST